MKKLRNPKNPKRKHREAKRLAREKKIQRLKALGHYSAYWSQRHDNEPQNKGPKQEKDYAKAE